MGWGLETSQVACCADFPLKKNTTLNFNAVCFNAESQIKKRLISRKPGGNNPHCRQEVESEQRAPWGMRNVSVIVSVGRKPNSVRATTVQKEKKKKKDF